MKKVKDERAQRAQDQRLLRKQLPVFLVEIGNLVDKSKALHLVRESSDVIAFVLSVAEEMEGRSGTDTEGELSLFEALSELARRRTTLTTDDLFTPAQILRWFAGYLEETMAKKDLQWQR